MLQSIYLKSEQINSLIFENDLLNIFGINMKNLLSLKYRYHQIMAKGTREIEYNSNNFSKSHKNVAEHTKKNSSNILPFIQRDCSFVTKCHDLI